MKIAVTVWNMAIPICNLSPGKRNLNNFMAEGCENCDRIDETKVTQKTASHVPNIIVNSTINTDNALRASHQTMVCLGRQRSANVPPIKENRKIGATLQRK